MWNRYLHLFGNWSYYKLSYILTPKHYDYDDEDDCDDDVGDDDDDDVDDDDDDDDDVVNENDNDDDSGCHGFCFRPFETRSRRGQCGNKPKESLHRKLPIFASTRL